MAPNQAGPLRQPHLKDRNFRAIDLCPGVVGLSAPGSYAAANRKFIYSRLRPAFPAKNGVWKKAH